MEDCNAQVGQDNFKNDIMTIMGQYSLDSINDNDKLLIDLCNYHHLSINSSQTHSQNNIIFHRTPHEKQNRSHRDISEMEKKIIERNEKK